MKNIVVIGASGVGGGSAVLANRLFWESRGEECFIVGTHHKPGRVVPGANATVPLDVTNPNWLSQLTLSNQGQNVVKMVYDYGFFCFARGEVGFPAEEATELQKENAFAMSVQPLLDMEASGLFKTLVAFSSFHELPICQLVYGSMVEAKMRLDEWAETSTGEVGRYVIKSGAFVSGSLRGVKIATARELQRRRSNLADKLVRAFGNPDLDRLENILKDRLLIEEFASFGNTKLTTGDDLVPAIQVILSGSAKPITCVVADQVFSLTPRYT